MAIRQIVVTLGTPATVALAAVQGSHVSAVSVRMESDTGNADVKFGTSALSATVYGGIIPAGPASAVTIHGYNAARINLEDLYFLGTSGQKVRLFVVTP